MHDSSGLLCNLYFFCFFFLLIPVKEAESKYQTAPCTVRSGECYKRLYTASDYCEQP